MAADTQQRLTARVGHGQLHIAGLQQLAIPRAPDPAHEQQIFRHRSHGKRAIDAGRAAFGLALL
ncbi:hypothetical protein D3C81_2006640 [compost metagenome]